MEKANRLATAWDAAALVTPPASRNGTEKGTEAASEGTQNVVEEVPLPAAAVEAIREEAAHVAEDAKHATKEGSSGGTSFYAPEPVVEAPAPTPAPTPSMDDLVAKVLARMSPEVLQAVTREILSPALEGRGKRRSGANK